MGVAFAQPEPRAISLGKSCRAVLVDADDHERMAAWLWTTKRINGREYVVRTEGRPRVQWLFHREVLGIRDARRVTFANGDHLDCRRANLVIFGSPEFSPPIGDHKRPILFFYCPPCRDYHAKDHPHYLRVLERRAARTGTSVPALPQLVRVEGAPLCASIFTRDGFLRLAIQRTWQGILSAKYPDLVEDSWRRDDTLERRVLRDGESFPQDRARDTELLAAGGSVLEKAAATAICRAGDERRRGLVRGGLTSTLRGSNQYQSVLNHTTTGRLVNVDKWTAWSRLEGARRTAEAVAARIVLSTPSPENHVITRVDLQKAWGLLDQDERDELELWATEIEFTTPTLRRTLRRLRWFLETGIMLDETPHAIGAARFRNRRPSLAVMADAWLAEREKTLDALRLIKKAAARGNFTPRVARPRQPTQRADNPSVREAYAYAPKLWWKSETSQRHARRIDATPNNIKRKRGVNAPSRTAGLPGSKKARTIAQRRRRH